MSSLVVVLAYLYLPQPTTGPALLLEKVQAACKYFTREDLNASEVMHLVPRRFRPAQVEFYTTRFRPPTRTVSRGMLERRYGPGKPVEPLERVHFAHPPIRVYVAKDVHGKALCTIQVFYTFGSATSIWVEPPPLGVAPALDRKR